MEKTQILRGKPVVDKLFVQTQELLNMHTVRGYIALFFYGENNPSAAYVRRKIAYAESLGIEARIFSDEATVYANIAACNTDDACWGMIVQLPLPTSLAGKKQELLNAIVWYKDIDCLGNDLLSRSAVGGGIYPDIAPATAVATVALLQHYDIRDTIGTKTVSILGKSDLVGNPLAQMVSHQGGVVCTFDEFSDQEHMRAVCRTSDIIMTATGVVHLVDTTFLAPTPTQTIIDIGRGLYNGKPAGDVDILAIRDAVAAYTPVPGGVGPVTVAALFLQMARLQTISQKE